MEETALKKERELVYNNYTDEDRRRYFFFIQQKLMAPFQTAKKAANAHYETARKWKTAYNKDPEKKIPAKKTNRTPSRPQSKLSDDHKAHLVFLMKTRQPLYKTLSRI